jgi:outer membrane protein
MNKIILGALTAAAVLLPATAQAQRAPAAVVVVVDTDRIARECTACRAASTQLQAQEATLRNRAQTLQTQLQTEQGPLQTAVSALAGKQPDAALKARIDAFQAKERNAQQELANGQRNLQSTSAHVSQQIGARLRPIISSLSTARGANLALEKGAMLFSAPAIDITDAVLAQLNQQLPAVSVTPLPQQPQQQPSQGR